jgi:hypothetical protein
MALKNRAIDRAAIKAPALNISLGSIGVLSLATALTAWKNGFEFLFERSTPGVRAAVLIATLGVIAIIVAADMLARAIATRKDSMHVVPMGKGWTASIVQAGADDPGYTVAAVRAGATGTECLLVKAGQAPTWHASDKIALQAPTT